MTNKTWYITGTSRGFGRAWAEAALRRGDRVAATARDVSTLEALARTYGDASKRALEGLTEPLGAEVTAFGIRTTLVEPGGYATDWAGASARRSNPLREYEPLREALHAGAGGIVLPPAEATVPAILALVDAPRPPTRLLLGAFAFGAATRVHEQRLPRLGGVGVGGWGQR